MFGCASLGSAATLPEDRADAMYHRYDGGGLEVDGPSILVRKSIGDSVSVWGNYYVDYVSSASVDVMATASPYSEQRDEWSAGADYLHEKTSLGFGVTRSEEEDYSSDTVHFGISQEFFGDLTTVGIAYSRGFDEVRARGLAGFKEDTDRRSYRVDLAQILTRDLVVTFNYETVSEEGFLNNPYRLVRFLDDTELRGFGYEREIYPRTRTSNAAALRGKYYLPYRAAVTLEGRWYQDTFDVDGYDVGLEYTHPIAQTWVVEGRYRYYSQNAASFYADIFPREGAQNFMARDKELSTFDSHTIGVGVSYDFSMGWMPWVTSGSLNLQVDYMMLSYDDFRDVTQGGPVGEEPLYDLNATIVRAFVSIYF